MSQPAGPAALDALKGLREFYRQCAALLRTADEIADDRGWKSWTGSQVLLQSSSALDRPEHWLPDTVFRHYRPAGRTDLTLFVAILLLPREGEHQATFSEPLLSVGWACFREPVTDPYLKPIWLARGGFWTPDARDRFLPFGVPATHAETVSVSRVANVPLWSIARPEDLRARFEALVADWMEHGGG